MWAFQLLDWKSGWRKSALFPSQLPHRILGKDLLNDDNPFRFRKLLRFLILNWQNRESTQLAQGPILFLTAVDAARHLFRVILNERIPATDRTYPLSAFSTQYFVTLNKAKLFVCISGIFLAVSWKQSAHQLFPGKSICSSLVQTRKIVCFGKPHWEIIVG